MLTQVGGANRLVRLLGTLRLGRILTYLVVLFTVKIMNLRLGSADGKPRKVDAVGTHVGDLTRFIEPLGHHHGLSHREAQFARCLLLQGGGGEGRCGRFLRRFRHHLIDGEG